MHEIGKSSRRICSKICIRGRIIIRDVCQMTYIDRTSFHIYDSGLFHAILAAHFLLSKQALK